MPKSLPPLSLYIHFPWCVRRCPYCDFNSHAIQGAGFPEAAYIEAVLKDMRSMALQVTGRSIQSIFMGGGTPSLMSALAVKQLLGGAQDNFELNAGCEITLEANPGTFEKDRFQAYKAAGVTRLSLGVQSLNEQALKAIGRIHTAQQAIAAIEAAQGIFKTFNLDLMYALPGQNLKELQQDLDAILSYKPSHLSVYHLSVEPNTYFAKFPPKLPDSDIASQMLDVITQQNEKAGLGRYEVSAYAASGHQSIHNRNYWEFGDYIGLGAGAHSKLSTRDGNGHLQVTREVRYRAPERYIQNSMLAGATAQKDTVLSADLPFEFMLGALRLKEGVPSHLFVKRTGLGLEGIKEELDKAVTLGLLHPYGQKIQATKLGFDFLNNLQELFLTS